MKIGNLEVSSKELDALLGLVFIVTQDSELCEKFVKGEVVNLRLAAYRLLHLMEQGKLARVLTLMALYTIPEIKDDKIIFTLPITEKIVEEFINECFNGVIKLER